MRAAAAFLIVGWPGNSPNWYYRVYWRKNNAAVRDPLTIYTHFILSSSIFATLRCFCCCFCSVAVKRKAVTTLVGGLFERLVSTSRAFYYCYSQYKGIWWVLYDNTLALSPRGNVNYFPLTPITKWIAAAWVSVTIITTNDIFFTTAHDQMTNSHPS